MELLTIIQIIIGSVLALFLPGYAWTRLIFYKTELGRIEILALSLGISIAILPLTIFYLNKFLGISINFTNLVLVALTLTLIPSIIWKIKKLFKLKD